MSRHAHQTPAAAPLHAVAPLPPGRSRRAATLKWLRTMHGWIGLWGAVLGLLFGGTGILLNHRAMLKIPAAQTQESTVQLPLPLPAPQSAEAMAQWLAGTLALGREPARIKTDKARPVAWGDKALQQPARWSMNFVAPQWNVQAEYWVGNSFVTVKRGDNNAWATLSNLHKGSGMSVAWILLVDTLAGSIILLSLSGLALWALQGRRRLLAAAVGGASLAATATLALQSM